jgi:hypothetical protein
MRSCQCTSHDLYVGGCQWQWQVCQWHHGNFVYVSLCVCVIPLTLFQVEFRVIVLSTSTNLTSYRPGSHVSYLESYFVVFHHTDTHISVFFLAIDLFLHNKQKILISRRGYSWWTDWDSWITDFPPTCWVALVFLSVPPSHTLPFTHFVVINWTYPICWF